MTQNSQPLVSVVVVAYCSADTVVQTLDSIYNQTYSNIQLILCDDCSTDDTVAVTSYWMALHGERFTECIIQANPVNLGVSGNLNSGIQRATGVYIKDIAADDLLLPDCIEKNVLCCEARGLDNVCSLMQPFCMRDGEKVACPAIDFVPEFFEKEVDEQYVSMLAYNRVFSPSFFSKRSFLESVGFYDTKYRLLEDYPLFLKAVRLGHKLNFMDAVTVEYRISDSSLSNTTQYRVTNVGYNRDMKRFFYHDRLPDMIKFGLYRRILNQMRHFFYMDLIVLFGNDRRKGLVRFVEKLKDKTLFKKG